MLIKIKNFSGSMSKLILVLNIWRISSSPNKTPIKGIIDVILINSIIPTIICNIIKRKYLIFKDELKCFDILRILFTERYYRN